MDRTMAVACVLAASLVPVTTGAQTAGLDSAARVAGFRLDPMVLEAPGPSLGATVRVVFGEALPAGLKVGVVVVQVAPNSPAARAGLQAGDVVVEFDRVAVTNARQFERLIQHTPPGRLTLMVAVRKGERRTFSLML
jgi:S1-C subfamily serine protease